MPRLPDLSVLGQRPTPQSGRQISTADLSAPGRAMAELGQTGQQIASVEFKKQAIEVEKQKQADDTQAVFAARRQLDDWERANIYDPQNGAVTRLGKDALDLPNTLPAKFDEFANAVGEGIQSPRARQAFQQVTQSRREQIGGWASRHALQQKNVYEEGQYRADIESSINRAAQLTDAGNTAMASAEIAIAGERTVGFLRQRGRSEEEISRAVREINSKAAAATVSMLLEKDRPMEADAYLKANSKGMDFDDLLRSTKAVGKAVDSHAAVTAATEVVNTEVVPALQPTDAGRLTSLVMAAESGGRRFGLDGKTLLTSSKGAKGEMQVLDSTNKNPGYGVKPAKDDSPDERARVGRDYLGAMLKEFGGDVPKALAAYNAGPDRVTKAVEAAAKGRSGSVDWLSYMPQETKDYVGKITTRYADGGGAPAMPTLQALQQRVRDRIGTSNPQRLKMALDEVGRQYDAGLKARKQGEDEVTAQAMQWLSQNGGRYSQMPASLRNAVPPKETDNLMNFGARVAKGDDITDPVVFQKMATDDNWLKGLTDAQFYMHSRKLSEADAEKMAMRRGGLLNKNQPGQKPTDMDTASVNAILNNRLQQIGVDPAPKDGDEKAMRVGAIRKFVWDSVLQAQGASGKKFNEVEITKVVDELFAKSVKFQTSFLGFKGSESQRLMALKPGDIPSDTRKRMEESFKKRGIEPTDADILGLYFELKAMQ